MINIAVNGFGRIGRIVTRINAINKRFNLVAINDIIPSIENMAYLFRYDSTYGKFPGTVKTEGDNILINGDKTVVTHKERLTEIPWEIYDVDVIIDSTGIEQNVMDAKKLVSKGKIKTLIYTMSSNNVDHEIIMGINDHTLKPEHKVLSASICDANAIAHVLNFIHNEFIISNGSVTTLHPWLSYQNLVDGAAKGIAPDPNKYTPINSTQNYGLGRASVDAIIPKTTTAVSCTEKILTTLKGKIASQSFRVPTDVVTCSDIVLQTEKKISYEELKQHIEQWANQNQYVGLNYDPRISLDYEGEELSAVIDMQWLQVKNDLIKVVVWYDNEWGYSCRVLDLVEKVCCI